MHDTNHKSIPEVRKRLKEIAEETGLEELKDLADQMHRRNLKGTRAPITSQKMTPELAGKIRDYLDDNPHASNQIIADYFNVNPGRITDALEP